MFSRLRKLPQKHSFFLFGPRGTGKTTLLKTEFDPEKCLLFDLLEAKTEDLFFRNPDELYKIVKAQSEEIEYIIIDEVQKIPKLLDVVHKLIEETDKIFILTGSSARKLKRGGANLLAGRAFLYHLFPLTSFEMGEQFDLDHALRWGALPKVHFVADDSEKEDFLRSYTRVYLKEEILDEQVLRHLSPFRRFLEVAAQSNGTVVNYAKIARDVGADAKTVANYFTILEDTLIGFFLDPYHNSFRKRLVGKPKFYFFDPGVVRALTGHLTIPLMPKTSAFGKAFEHYVILQCKTLASYFEPDWSFSYLQTLSGVEVDLVIERPGKPLLCMEIKSTDDLNQESVSSFIHLTKDIPDAEAVIFSRDRYLKKYDHVTCYPWQQGLEYLFAGMRTQ